MMIIFILGVICVAVYSIYEILSHFKIIKVKNKIVVRVFMILGIIGIVIPAIFQIKEIGSKPRVPVDVYPRKLCFYENNWTKYSQFIIKNNKDIPLFAVWIKLHISDKQLDTAKIKLKLDNQEFIRSGILKDISVVCDVIGLVAKDKRGRKNIYLIIYKLLPLKDRVFEIKYDANTDNVKSHLLSCVKLSALSFQQEPTDILLRQGEIAIKIMPPEIISISGMFIWTKKIDEF